MRNWTSANTPVKEVVVAVKDWEVVKLALKIARKQLEYYKKMMK